MAITIAMEWDIVRSLGKLTPPFWPIPGNREEGGGKGGGEDKWEMMVVGC